MYTIGFYWLHEGTRKDWIMLEEDFFLGMSSNKKKYHVVKWESLATCNDSGGLGFIDMRATMLYC